tara:strand:+ start:1466 stop:2215 length:750 start_codon:yes stop_codon:yes gene_type:complete
MKDKLKLKHIDVLAEVDESKRDLSSLMIDVFGYKKTFFGRKKMLFNSFFGASDLAQEVSNMDYKEIKINKDSHIVNPMNIDSISYLAMLDLQRFCKDSNKEELALHIANVNAIATYEENKTSKYSISSKSFERYRDHLLEQNLFDMIGLYNWVLESIGASTKQWNERFLSVEVIDKDLDSVGGHALHQFNVVNTIKGICKDFNVSESEAWYISYNLVMTNSYSKSYEGYLQDQIRIKKEAEMKAKNKQY